MTVAERIRTEELNGLRLPPTPADRLDESQPNQAPVQNDRSFLNPRLLADLPAAARQFPVDPNTGVPLAVLTHGTDQPAGDYTRTNHHHANYARTHPDLEGRLAIDSSSRALNRLHLLPIQYAAGLAVRVSRTQRLTYDLHDAIHDRYTTGPELPHSVKQKFSRAVAQTANVVPRLAVDVTIPDKDNLVEMDDLTYVTVTDPRHIHIEDYYYDRPAGYQQTVLGIFFLRFAASQDLSHLPESRLTQFIAARNRERRRELGSQLLREAVEVGIDPLQRKFNAWNEDGLVAPANRHRMLGDVVWQFATPEIVDKIAPTLQTKLKEAA